MSPAVRGAGLDTSSSWRSCLHSGDPTFSLAERGAPECPRRPLASLGLCTHARTLSLLALPASPRRAAPPHRRPASSRTRQTPSTLRAFALHPRLLAADLAQSTPIADVRGDRRRAASFNAPFSRIALARDDTKKPSSFSDTGRPGAPMLQRTEAEELRRGGATEVVQPEVEASAALIRQALARLALPQPQAEAYLDRFREAIETAEPHPAGGPQVLPEVREALLPTGQIAGQSLRQARIRERFGITVVAIIQADGAILNPPPDAILRAG